MDSQSPSEGVISTKLGTFSSFYIDLRATTCVSLVTALGTQGRKNLQDVILTVPFPIGYRWSCINGPFPVSRPDFFIYAPYNGTPPLEGARNPSYVCVYIINCGYVGYVHFA